MSRPSKNVVAAFFFGLEGRHLFSSYSKLSDLNLIPGPITTFCLRLDFSRLPCFKLLS